MRRRFRGAAVDVRSSSSSHHRVASGCHLVVARTRARPRQCAPAEHTRPWQRCSASTSIAPFPDLRDWRRAPARSPAYVICHYAWWFLHVASSPHHSFHRCLLGGIGSLPTPAGDARGLAIGLIEEPLGRRMSPSNTRIRGVLDSESSDWIFLPTAFWAVPKCEKFLTSTRHHIRDRIAHTGIAFILKKR